MQIRQVQHDPDFPGPRRSRCPHAEEGCAGAALCRFAPPARQCPQPLRLRRGGTVALGPVPVRRRFHAVRAGLAAVVARAPDGRRQILCLSGPGELVCPAVPGGDDHALEALAPLTLCEIVLEPGCSRLARDADFAETLYALAGRGLADSAARLVALGRMDAPSRLAAFLVEMGGRLGRPGRAGLTLALPMTREDIADYLGLNPETVSRQLGRLRRAGLIEMRTPTRMAIPDPAVLERLARP